MSFFFRVVCLSSAMVIAACGGDASAKAGAGNAAGGGSQKKSASGVIERKNLPIVLGTSDIVEVLKGPIDASIGIQGNLSAIEQIDVRARMEGNIVSVNVREGTPVRVGQEMALFDDATAQGDRASAEADVVSANSDLANAQWTADQSADLFKAGAIAERDLRTAQSALTAAKARLAAAEARLKASSQTASDTRVLAPTNGVVSARSVGPGEHVTRGSVLFTVVRSDVLELQAAVPGRLADAVAAGQVVRFTSDGREFSGRVARVNPTIDPSSRAVMFYVEIPNGNGAIKANAFATGRVIGRTVPNATLLRTSAVRVPPPGSPDTRPYVYAIRDETLERRPVTTGIVDDIGGVTQILDGLQPGDRVVGGNIATLGSGMKVQIVSSDQARGGREVAPGGDGANQGPQGVKPASKGAGDSSNGQRKATQPDSTRK